MDANQRILELITQRGWSEYKLAKESGLAQSTIATLFRRNTLPSVTTIEAICDAMGITMAQFFTPEIKTPILLTQKQRKILDKYSFLSPKMQKVIEDIMDDHIKNT